MPATLTSGAAQAALYPNGLARLTLVIGGARSGKSGFAERLCLASGLRPLYLATAEARDAEMAARIADHQQRRGSLWRRVEAPLELVDALEAHAGIHAIVLVDCLTLWLSNLIEADRAIEAETARLIEALARLTGPVVFVSNEVGLGIVPDNALARRFRDEAGRLNQRIAATADRVVFIAAGLPLTLKGVAA
ncbi:MAG: bifunctional adenosylcobinamide kinase/adenosylcobinamide-phosphate guanylyltransferase [Alphaproteobacteria bacterium]|nr:bifunctional adenosylcobinamide kinase/adenosylcobinamide-phosphate guanylyltransferase [Alphaproteobacteria bacterium]